MTKIIIAPIVSLIVLVLQLFGIIVPEEIVDELTLTISNAIFVIIAFIGIVTGQIKKKEKAKN